MDGSAYLVFGSPDEFDHALSLEITASPPTCPDPPTTPTCGLGISPKRLEIVVGAVYDANIVYDLVDSTDLETELRVQYGAKAVDLGNNFAIAGTLLPLFGVLALMTLQRP